MSLRLGRLARNLGLHLIRCRPACGCGAFTLCLACPRWKLEAQARYHEEGAAGLHPLPDFAPGWRRFHHADSWHMRRLWAEGFASYGNDLLRSIRAYQRQRGWLLLAAGVLAGCALASGSALAGVCALVLVCWAFREELADRPRRLARFLRRAWVDACQPEGDLAWPRDLSTR